MKGWLDNFNGPVGMLVGGGKGILRVVHANPTTVSDFIPVDVAIKAMLITTHKRGIKTITEDSTIHIYNCSSYNVKRLDIRQIVEMGFEIVRDIPLEGIIWSPRSTITKSVSVYYMLMLLLHILPAVIIDMIIKLIGSRPILLKLQRKVYVSNSALSYFLLNEWQFRNDKLMSLFDSLEGINLDNFGFKYRDLDILEYFKNGIIGAKIYLLKEDMNQLEKARLHRRRIDWIDTITTTLFVTIVIWIFYRNNVF